MFRLGLICGYALQCVVCKASGWNTAEELARSNAEGNDSEDGEERNEVLGIGNQSSVAKRCEYVNTMGSLLW
ncbi:hypothetical protein HAX54_037686 [Datura stramonium]|uniref:Secreted protein n=1 Tax=Datura stramonium TaxID=4076 RepID=A0ABS8VMN2_DATST|nr:hypothetical protein [Datura stramonium]